MGEGLQTITLPLKQECESLGGRSLHSRGSSNLRASESSGLGRDWRQSEKSIAIENRALLFLPAQATESVIRIQTLSLPSLLACMT